MDDGLRRFIEDWEVESYRKGISAAGRAVGRVAGKIAIVTALRKASAWRFPKTSSPRVLRWC